MKTIYSLLLLCFALSYAFGQGLFYYGNGQKIPLSLSDKSITIKFKSNVTENEINDLISSDPDIGNLEKMTTRDFQKVNFKRAVRIQDLLSRLQASTKVERVNPAYKLGEMEMLTSDLFRVQFHSSVTRAEIDAMNEQYNVEIVEEVAARPGVFTFRVKSPAASVLDITNQYYEDSKTEWAVPQFFHRWNLHSIPNDTYFTNQYYLHNTGQNGGVVNADIDAPEAWDITLGSSSIVIAVIDEGVSTGQNPAKPAHEDLPAGRLDVEPGSDIYGNSGQYDDDPSPEGNQAHGMAVAGIIAASRNNGTGIAGIAPNCKIMPIRVFGERYDDPPLDDFKFADAIDFARTRNADVINNSWSAEGYGYWNDDVAYAIYLALTQGRGGKGCVVIHSAGNNAIRSMGTYGYVEFPANVPGVISVGATNKSNNIQNYSPRSALSDSIDLVAPSGNVSTIVTWYDCGKIIRYWFTMFGDIWTLDIPGDPGHNNGLYGASYPDCFDKYTATGPEGDEFPYHYAAAFGGTSASCPQAAGVAALILSLNPNFTQSQVQYFMKQSAVDMGANNWDVDFGYGRLNANQALLRAAAPAITAPVVKNHWCYNTQKTITWTSNLQLPTRSKLRRTAG